MNLKKILLIILLIIIVVGLMVVITIKSSENNVKDNGKLNVVVTSFSTYDFIRQIGGDKVNITFLLGPGADSHSYEPSAQDLITIQDADLFIYVGGEMEKWADRVLETLDLKDTKVVRVMGLVDVVEEEQVDGGEIEGEHEDHSHEDEVEYDEHIWSSPANAIVIIQNLAEILSEIDDKNAEIYNQNSDNYIVEIRGVQAAIQEIVDNKIRDRLVFGDKMPMQYFLNEFGLDVTAAFNGCSTETEPSAATIANLINRVKTENIPVILYIELNQGTVANIIAEETGAEPMQIQTLHNVTKSDFENGETYVSLMTRNLEVLKKALQ